MANNDFRKLSQLLDVKIKPLHGEIARIHHDLSDLRSTYLKSSVELSRMSKDVSRIDSELEEITETLNSNDTGLEAISRRLDSNTSAVMKLESTVNGYAEMYDTNKDNISKLDKRLDLLEEDAGIEVPPELKLADVA